MINNQDLQNSFERIKELSAQPNTRVFGTGLWGICHDLADARYPPAKELFINLLNHPRWDWRRVSVSLLGFHFHLEPAILEKIRDMLIYDSDSRVRMAAASVVGSQGKLPEKALVRALILDSDKFVREAAFSSILKLAGVPYKTKLLEVNKVRSGEIEPSIDQVRRILRENKLSVNLKLLE